jgi:IS5 family transposase
MNKLSNYKELRNNKSLFDEAMSTDVLNDLGNPLDALSRLVDFEQFRPTLFDEAMSTDVLNDLGNPLDALSRLVDFEQFRPTLESALFTGERKSKAGRPPFDCVLMFKVLFLQRYYGLGDHQIQYQIIDRTSFRKFLGIRDVRDVPDEKTVWNYKEMLTRGKVYDRLFDDFRASLDEMGFQFNEGRIIDASFVVAPRQRNTREENKAIKEGRGDELWNDEPHKKSHKDVDARWTEKRGEKFYGYKMHAKVDQRHKMVLKYDTTSANVHDSKGYEPLLDKSDEGKELYLDAGYESQEPIVEKHRMKPVICEKGHRNHPLTDEQKKKNREKSKTRCLVEHVFGFMEQSMCGLIFRRVGMLRARADVAMTCIVYNICRYTQIMRLNPVSIAYNRN